MYNRQPANITGIEHFSTQPENAAGISRPGISAERNF
jgi:hypothetical protein